MDDARFDIVLYNLLSNSVRHTSGGHIKISVKLLNLQQYLKKLEKQKSSKKILDANKFAIWG